MKPLHIKSGKLSVIGSGVIIPFDENEITISFQLPSPSNDIYDVDIMFKFLEDSSRGPCIEFTDPWEGRDKDDIGRLSEYSLNIYNCDISNPVATTEPIKLGDFEGLKLYLNFIAKYETTDEKNIIFYSIYTSL